MAAVQDFRSLPFMQGDPALHKCGSSTGEKTILSNAYILKGRECRIKAEDLQSAIKYYFLC